MRKSLFILIALTALVLAQVACSISGVINDVTNIASNEDKTVVELTGEITEIDIPGNFSPDYSLHIVSVTLVGYSDAADSHIMMIQVPDEAFVNMEDLERQLNEKIKDQNVTYSNIQMKLVEERPVTVRGQDTMMKVYEGTNNSGETWRLASVFFEGKGGKALLTVAGEVAKWDAEMVDGMIASMK